MASTLLALVTIVAMGVQMTFDVYDRVSTVSPLPHRIFSEYLVLDQMSASTMSEVK